MPHCEVEGCGKKDLTPSQIVYHERSNMIVCEECAIEYDNVVPLFPGDLDTEEMIDYDIKLSREEGIEASLRVGNSRLLISSSAGDLKKIFK